MNLIRKDEVQKIVCLNMIRVIVLILQEQLVANKAQSALLQNETKGIEFSKIRRGLQNIVSKNYVSSPRNALEVVEAFYLQKVWENFGLSQDIDDPKPFLQPVSMKETFPSAFSIPKKY
ncbi:hypothetical protein CVS40_8612 [Lucilia cuprina]|nr:hypothetical protein CVS40_8612 [Lucilia cuprina]